SRHSHGLSRTHVVGQTGSRALPGYNPTAIIEPVIAEVNWRASVGPPQDGTGIREGHRDPDSITSVQLETPRCGTPCDVIIGWPHLELRDTGPRSSVGEPQDALLKKVPDDTVG